MRRVHEAVAVQHKTMVSAVVQKKLRRVLIASDT
jgi:hypothetical protein